MPKLPSSIRVNRNGVVGDFASFAPERLSMKQIVEKAIAIRDGNSTEPERLSKELFRYGNHSLVRYKLASDELRHDLDAAGLDVCTVDRGHCSVILGVRDLETGSLDALIDIIDDKGDGGPRIHYVHEREGCHITSETMVAILGFVDVPPSWRAGGDHKLAKRFDAWYDWDTGRWEVREPTMLVSVRFERLCFATAPALRESIDVFLLPEADQDMESPDAEAAYWARDYYRNAAWEHLHKFSQEVRAGFSSWSPNEPQLVKVVGEALKEEIAALRAARHGLVSDEDADADPPGPKP